MSGPGLGISEPAGLIACLSFVSWHGQRESWNCSARGRGGSEGSSLKCCSTSDQLGGLPRLSPVCPSLTCAEEPQNGCQGPESIPLLGAWLGQVGHPIQGLLLCCGSVVVRKAGSRGLPFPSLGAAFQLSLPELHHSHAHAWPARACCPGEAMSLTCGSVGSSPPSAGYSLHRRGVPACLNCL